MATTQTDSIQKNEIESVETDQLMDPSILEQLTESVILKFWSRKISLIFLGPGGENDEDTFFIYQKGPSEHHGYKVMMNMARNSPVAVRLIDGERTGNWLIVNSESFADAGDTREMIPVLINLNEVEDEPSDDEEEDFSSNHSCDEEEEEDSYQFEDWEFFRSDDCQPAEPMKEEEPWDGSIWGEDRQEEKDGGEKDSPSDTEDKKDLVEEDCPYDAEEADAEMTTEEEEKTEPILVEEIVEDEDGGEQPRRKLEPHEKVKKLTLDKPSDETIKFYAGSYSPEEKFTFPEWVVEIRFSLASPLYLDADVLDWNYDQLWLATGDPAGQHCIAHCAQCQSVLAYHVWNKRFPALEHYVALDCEMVQVHPDPDDIKVTVGQGQEMEVLALGRVSIVDQVGKIILDTYVQPTRKVKDCKTDKSGLTEEHLKQGRPFLEVQQEVMDILKNKILVIHDPRKDFEVLGFEHPKADTRDTSYHPILTQKVRPNNIFNRIALWRLAKRLYGWNIQQGAHCSVVDARAAMWAYTHAHNQWAEGLTWWDKYWLGPRQDAKGKEPPMALTDDTSKYVPRLCNLVKWPDFAGYGFNLHVEKDEPGTYIGLVAPGSPAELGGLKEGDRIIEVNGENVEKHTHVTVIQKIKSRGGKTSMLVVDRATDYYLESRSQTICSSVTSVVVISTPSRNPEATETVVADVVAEQVESAPEPEEPQSFHETVEGAASQQEGRTEFEAG